jgi:DNA ligase 1
MNEARATLRPELGLERFAALYRRLDASTSTTDKQVAMIEYFQSASDGDAAWAVYFLSGGRPRQMVPSRHLRQLAQDACALDAWLFQECYDRVGDLSETFDLLMRPPSNERQHSLEDWLIRLQALRGQSLEFQSVELMRQWSEIPVTQRLVYFKLMLGSFRVGVSRLQVTQALSKHSGVDAKLVAQRLMGFNSVDHVPSALEYRALVHQDVHSSAQDEAANALNPYPFFLAHAVLDQEVNDEHLGSSEHWLMEWKWDGIRAQLIKRKGQVAVWSRGEELLTDRFPEILQWFAGMPDGVVLDGELVIADALGGETFERTNSMPVTTVPIPFLVRPFAQLQKRIGRKKISTNLLRDLPAFFIAFDVLDWQGRDCRSDPLAARRALLSTIYDQHRSAIWALSPTLTATTWSELRQRWAGARSLGAEGLMIKAKDSHYGVGRTKAPGVWWKWKLEPFSVDAVLLYAQKGHGRRGGLFSDYTFAVWTLDPEAQQRKLVPFAKAYSGLTDLEIKEVDAIVRKTSMEAFGPVRSVEPTLVFEIAFEGISLSPRHSSGYATRFPRMVRWRRDKRPEDADSVDTLAHLVNTSGAPLQ